MIFFFKRSKIFDIVYHILIEIGMSGISPLTSVATIEKPIEGLVIATNVHMVEFTNLQMTEMPSFQRSRKG